MSSLESLRRKAAGLLVIRLGSNMNPPRRAEEEAADVRALLERHPLGGIILFNGTWPETRETLAELQRVAERPLLVMTDMERGLGQQAAGATLFPHLRAFGEIDDPELTADFARVSAREALACGVHVALAPVADVNRNPDNPIISTRAFGETTVHVGRHTAAYVRGLRAEGLLATVKHFPGHGNTAEDSHATLPTVRDPRDEIAEYDLPAFRDGFDAGAELTMTAHVAYPALDGSGLPATLSHAILTDLLRGEMGFTGVVISDSLHMAGIRPEGRTEGEVSVDQIVAGVDLLLDPQDPVHIIETVAHAVMDGRLAETRLDEALERAQRLRHQLTDRFGARLWTDPASAVPPGEVGSVEHQELAMRAAREAVRLEGRIPFAAGDSVVAVLMRSRRSHLEPAEQPLGEALRQRLPGIAYFELDPESSETARAVVREAAAKADAVLLALIVKPAAWQSFGLPDDLQAVGTELVAGRRSAVIALGDRRALDPFSNVAARIVTFSDTPVSQVAVVEAIMPTSGAK